MPCCAASPNTSTISLSDTPGPQQFDIRASGAHRVELEAVGLTHTKSALPAALAEVEFLVRK